MPSSGTRSGRGRLGVLATQVLEGTDRCSRFVVIEFPSLEQAVACQDSAACQSAAAHRKAQGVGVGEAKVKVEVEVEVSIVEAV